MVKIADRDAGGILLVGHGLLTGHDAPVAADGLAAWAERNQIVLWPLPVPAFLQRPLTVSGRPAPPQVAERLAELDELETVFERIAAELARGREVLGLAAPPDLVSTRSGRAWLDRVRAIASGVARLQLTVWPVDPDGADFRPEGELIRSAS
ncbi:MAG: hypothetical protein QM695_15375 [Micropruina sp.]